MMLGWILGAIGGLGSLGAIAACIFIPGAGGVLLGALRAIGGFLAKIPWYVYAGAALIALIAFLVISRGHAIDRYKADEERAARVCQAVRDVAGRPRQNCELNELQIHAFGKTIGDLTTALADQNRRIRELGQRNVQLQAEAAVAERQAARRAGQAEDVSKRLDESARHAPAQPCPVSKALGEQWQ